MTDWNRLALNAKRSGHFAGRTAVDEDAYYSAFSGDGASEHSSDRLTAQIKDWFFGSWMPSWPTATNETGWSSMR